MLNSRKLHLYGITYLQCTREACENGCLPGDRKHLFRFRNSAEQFFIVPSPFAAFSHGFEFISHMSAKVKFNNANPVFFQSLKKAVDSYFETKGIRRSGNWKLYRKAITVISFSVALYLFLLLERML